MRLVLILSLILLCTACSTTLWSQSNARPFKSNSQLVASSHHAVTKLLAGIPADHPLDPKKPIIVASLVNIDDLSSSRLGRLISEQLMTRLVESGYTVTELKLRESIYIRHKEGELMLSREIPEISRKHAAQAVLVGTYATSINTLYLTIKLVGVADNQVISSYDYVMPMDTEIRSFFWSKPM